MSVKKIVVAGGTGVLGRHVVQRARAAGHTVVPLSRSAGQDVVAGTGLAEAMSGADVVIDVSNVPTLATKKSVDFFRRATGNLLAAEQAAEVAHHVAVSIIGIDAETTGYYAGKVEQERLVTSGPVPWSLLRATQFHEFVPQVLQRTVGPLVLLPAMRTATVAAAEVAQALVALSDGPAHGRAPDLGGPEEAELADLVKRYLAAKGQRGRVVRLPLPGAAGKRMRQGAFLPGPGADRGKQTFGEWLAEA